MKMHLPLALAIALAVPAAAQDSPLGTQVNKPAPAGFYIFGIGGGGATPKARSDPSVQFGQSIRIAIPDDRGPMKRIGVNSRTSAVVKSGDTITMLVWLRLEAGASGATTAPAHIQMQLGRTPYSELFGKDVQVGKTWQLFSVQGKAPKTYQAGEMAGAVMLASGKHVFDVGALVIFAKPG